MKRFVVSALVAVFALVPLAAQNEVILKYDYASFKGVEISGDFKLSYVPSDSYSVKLTVDKLLEEYTKAYVKNGVLHIFVDSKALTPEMKKAFKGRNAIIPVQEAEVTAPTLEELYLADNVSLKPGTEIKGRKILINMTGNTKAEDFRLDTDKAKLVLGGTASVKADIAADSLSLSASGNSNAEIKNRSRLFLAKTTGATDLVLEGSTLKYQIESESNTRISLSGTADTLAVKAGGTCKVSAKNLAVKISDLTLFGNAKCRISATENLKLDMSGRSSVIYDGKPAIEIVKIVSSTVTRQSDEDQEKW